MRREGSLLLAMALLCTPLTARTVVPTLIRGTVANPAEWKQVVLFEFGTSTCTGTVVGPRTVISAAHCFKANETVNFKTDGKTFTGKVTQHNLYPAKDIDLAIVVTTEDITGVTPQKIGGTAELSKEVTMLGYGCTEFPAPATPDNILRIGKSTTIGYSGFKVATRTPGGVALCFGDDGGPLLLGTTNTALLIGVSSLGNKKDTNYHTRLDRTEAQTFLKDQAQSQGLVICGINSDCNTDPTPLAPSCRLSANPSSVKVNESVSLVLSSTNAVSASIDGVAVNVPNGERRITTTAKGSFTATAQVANAAGQTASCQASYTVSEDVIPDPLRPTCRITATPSTAQVNENIVLEITTTGNPVYTSINGNQVPSPVGRINVSHTVAKAYSATGFVRASSGSANCFVNYTVEDGTTPPPIAEFSLTPTHCGNNQYPESGIKSACIAMVKKDPSWNDVKITQALLLTYSDNSQEVLAPLAKSSATSKEEWTAYTGLLAKGTAVPVLDTRKATITKILPGEIPTAIEGRSARGRYFLVPSLASSPIRAFLPTLKTKEIL